MSEAFDKRRLALSLAVVMAGFALNDARAATPAPTSEPARTAPAARLTLEDLTAPESVRLPTLSPSGRTVALVRRVGDLDYLVVWDVAKKTARTLLTTNAVPKQAAKKNFRQEISYLAWKSEDRLVASIDIPVDYLGELFLTPVHMVLDAEGKTPALRLNEKVAGKTGTVEISWIVDILRGDPGHVMIGVQKSFEEVQVVRAEVATGQREVLEKGGDDVVGYGTDHKGNIITRMRRRDDGSLTLEGRSPGQKAWVRAFEFGRKDYKAFSKFDFLGAGEFGKLYVAVKPETPADGDTKAVRTYDLATHSLGPVVWSNPAYDVAEIVQAKDTGKLLAGCYRIDTLHCDFSDDLLNANFRGLDKYFGGKRDLSIVSQSDDDQTWILMANGPVEPAGFYVYDVKAHNLEFLADAWDRLPTEKLAGMDRFTFKSRDGVDLWAYVSAPPAAPKGPLPLVVMPHGGPEVRDDFGFDTWAQFLASRGYMVLQPNFRGSGGFGQKFGALGYGEWGGRMHDDVMDATRALIAAGRVDPKRVCIVGASYGGYEALYAAAKEPETFRCAVSIDGLSDLIADLKWERSFGKTSERNVYWVKSMGDFVADQAKLEAKSPVSLVADWKTPVLLIHGDKDDIVQVEQSRKMKRALEAAHKTVRYVQIKDMEHGPSTTEETTKVLGEVGSFLESYLGSLGPTGSTVTPAKAP